MAKANGRTAESDLGNDLLITRRQRPLGGVGTWLIGTVGGYGFNALVFPGHADAPAYEIGDSRISKLWLRRRRDAEVVFNWDRGADVPAADEEVRQVVDFLCEGLAESAYAA